MKTKQCIQSKLVEGFAIFGGAVFVLALFGASIWCLQTCNSIYETNDVLLHGTKDIYGEVFTPSYNKLVDKVNTLEMQNERLYNRISDINTRLLEQK